MTRASLGVAHDMSLGARRLLTVGRLVLVLVTLLCLSSMGGAMLLAFPVLVPLHWLAARDSGPYAVGGWALLAGLSVFEGAWMLTYLASNSAGVGLAVGLTGAVVVAAFFLLRAAGRSAARPAGV